MELADLCEIAASTGYQAICMRPSQISIESTSEQISAAVETLGRYGLSVTMVSGDIDIVYNNDRGPSCLSNIQPHLELATALGAPLIRVCLKHPSDVELARRAADQAAARGLTLVQQCHVQSPFETADQIETNLRAIDHPNFGLIFEAANLQQCGQPYGRATIDRLVPWIRNVYLQNQRLHPNGTVTLDTWKGGSVSFDVIDIPESGSIQFEEIFNALKNVGYEGPVTVHQSAPKDGTSCRESAAQTAKILARLMQSPV